MAGNSVKISISVPRSLLVAIDSEHPNRSSFFTIVAEAELRRTGKLMPDALAVELVRVRELIETRGVEVVRAKLNELSIEAANAEKVA